MTAIPARVTRSSRKSYVVQPGDSLYSLASQFGTSWPAIYNANKRVIGPQPVIQPGQTLTIPIS